MLATINNNFLESDEHSEIMLSQLLAKLTTNDKLIKVIYRPFYLNSYHLYLSDDVFGCVGSWEGALDWDTVHWHQDSRQSLRQSTGDNLYN